VRVRCNHVEHRQGDPGEPDTNGGPGIQDGGGGPEFPTGMSRGQIQNGETRRAPPSGREEQQRPIRASHAPHYRRHRTSLGQGPRTNHQMPRQRSHQKTLHHHPRHRLSQDQYAA